MQIYTHMLALIAAHLLGTVDDPWSSTRELSLPICVRRKDRGQENSNEIRRGRGHQQHLEREGGRGRQLASGCLAAWGPRYCRTIQASRFLTVMSAGAVQGSRVSVNPSVKRLKHEGQRGESCSVSKSIMLTTTRMNRPECEMVLGYELESKSQLAKS